MNPSTPKNSRDVWSRVLIIVGSVGMLVGAIDPLEGSLLILPGSGLVALGTYLGNTERRFFAYRLAVFIMIAIGVGALWGLSSAGGFGGTSGRSMWWGVLILPYLIGWSAGIWGPSSPRWLLTLGIAVGLWYLVILGMVAGSARGFTSVLPALVIGCTGMLTIAGCINRLRKHIGARA